MRLQRLFGQDVHHQFAKSTYSPSIKAPTTAFSYNETAEIDYKRVSKELGLHHSYIEFI